jgi:protein-S-isoprenylcysteine O-methyltransferase Ste14
VLTYLLAVLASGANATASVLQRKANLHVPRDQNLSPRLIWSLLHEPVWFGGVLAVFAGFLLQASALGSGQISAVEPILVLELPITLLLASRMFRAPMPGREWAATAAMTAALAALLYCLSPSAGRPGAVPWYAWITGIGVNLALVAVMVAWGTVVRPGAARRPARAALTRRPCSVWPPARRSA